MRFGAKKTLVLLLGPFIPLLVAGMCFLIFNNILFFFLGLFPGIVLSFVLCNLLLRHPFLDAMLGKGNICFYVTETGFWIPFIVKAVDGFIVGKVAGKNVEGVMNRSLLSYFQQTKHAEISIDYKQNMNISLKMNPEEYANARMAMEQMGFFIYSEKLKQFITKEMISELNNDTFSKHMITYTAAKIRDLSLNIRDFTRAYVDLHKPQQSIWEKPWFITVIIILVLVVAGYFLLPHLLKFFNIAASSVDKGLTAPAAILKK